jgi:hypothetical protein
VLYAVVAYVHLELGIIRGHFRSRTLALVEYITLEITGITQLPLLNLFKSNRASSENVNVNDANLRENPDGKSRRDFASSKNITTGEMSSHHTITSI